MYSGVLQAGRIMDADFWLLVAGSNGFQVSYVPFFAIKATQGRQVSALTELKPPGLNSES